MTKQEEFGDQCWDENYKNGRYNRYPYDEVVSFVLRNFKNKANILDLGCGGGNNSLFFLNEGHNVVAVDGSITSLSLTRSLCSDNPKLTSLHNDFRNLTVEDNTIDLVVDRQSMGHNSRTDIVKIINELFRVLKKGGKIQSYLFSDTHPSILKDSFIGKDNYLKFETGIFSQSGFVYFTNKSDIEDLFSKFKILDIRLCSTKSLINDFGYEYFIVELEKE